jgi:hypothetical protein
MYDVKPEVYTALSSIPNTTVSDAFPKGLAETPRITFGEANNANYLKMKVNRLSEINIQIDVWHKSSTGALAALVDGKMNELGFIREFASDLNDPSGIKRKTMRYRGIVDSVTKLVHQ